MTNHHKLYQNISSYDMEVKEIIYCTNNEHLSFYIQTSIRDSYHFET